MSVMSDGGSALPRISIVTPCYNQKDYIEATIMSVLEQQYSNLEYVVVDGESTDGSAAIIEKYSAQLAYWHSRPDNGQYDAINIGFQHTSGEIMAWLNSDDMYFPWTLHVVAEIFTRYPEIEWLTSVLFVFWDTDGHAVACGRGEGFNREAFYRGRNAGISGFHSHFIVQESTFWRRSLWEAAGGRLDTNLTLAGDFELWARFWQHATLYSTTALLAGFRVHEGQKTASGLELYRREALRVLGRYPGQLPSRVEVRTRSAISGLSGFSNIRKRFGWRAEFVEYDISSRCWVTSSAWFV